MEVHLDGKAYDYLKNNWIDIVTSIQYFDKDFDINNPHLFQYLYGLGFLKNNKVKDFVKIDYIFTIYW